MASLTGTSFNRCRFRQRLGGKACLGCALGADHQIELAGAQHGLQRVDEAHHLIRRTLLALCATAFGVTASTGALAQAYPAKPIRLVVPFPPGSGTDIIAREVSQKVAATNGWTFAIENKAGAGGNLGVDTVAKSAPDGYTLVLGQTSNLAINPSLYSKLPHDPVKGLAPVGLLATAPLVIVVPANSPYKTLADLVAAEGAKPGEVNIASPGNGTVAHLTSEQFQKAAGIKLQHVPYKGANQALNDVIGGQVQLYVSSVPSVLQQIRTGKLRPLAVTSDKRVADLPQTQTVGEAGYKGFDAVTGSACSRRPARRRRSSPS